MCPPHVRVCSAHLFSAERAAGWRAPPWGSGRGWATSRSPQRWSGACGCRRLFWGGRDLGAVPTRGVRRALRCGAALRSATGRAGGGGLRTQRSGAAPATVRRPGHRSTAAQHVAHTFAVTRCEPAPALSRASVAHAVVPGAPYARMAAAGGSPAHVVAALFILRAPRFPRPSPPPVLAPWTRSRVVSPAACRTGPWRGRDGLPTPPACAGAAPSGVW